VTRRTVRERRGGLGRGKRLLLVDPARQGGFESVCVVGLGSFGALTAEYPWVAESRPQPLSDGLSPRLTGERLGHPFGQSSKSRGARPVLSETSGLVCEPCHNVASLKYSFWAPAGTALRPAGVSWGGLDHVIETEADHVSPDSDLSVGGKQRGTMNLWRAIPRDVPRPGGSYPHRSG
jgi:hypothetical protein